nr:probable protein phosphatase 2C 47 [Tanacetum cinerariifolium]
MRVSQDQAATTETTMTMKMTEKSTLQLNMLLDDAVLISKKLAAMKSNEDQHIHIDDVAKHLGDDVYKWANRHSSFYAVFDGHGGAEASLYVKNHAMRLFFENSDLPAATTSDGSVDELFLKELQDLHCKAFLPADKDLKEEFNISDYCGTTALTVLALGMHLLISNAGDCRAVISRKGVAKQMYNDHRPSNLLEKKRVEELGGYFEDGYLNGELAVTRALGDRCMKSESPLIAEPEMTEIVLTNDDEFMIIGCDWIWDVMSNEEAVSLVRKQLMQHNDPQRLGVQDVDSEKAHSRDTTLLQDNELLHSECLKTTYLQEKTRWKELESLYEDGYLNGELAVKQAIG